MILVDTSAWIRHFSNSDSFDMRSICPAEDRLLCLPVYQEILQGIRNESAFRRIKESLDAAVFIENPLDQSIFLQAAGLYRTARRQGVTIRSGIDCLIAACAIRHNVPVLHHDRDFKFLSEISELVAKSV